MECDKLIPYDAVGDRPMEKAAGQSDIRKYRGFVYRLLRRGKRAVVYEQFSRGELIGYEVIERRVRPPRVIKGVLIHAVEAFPNDEAFGKWAWISYTAEQALRRFAQLEIGHV